MSIKPIKRSEALLPLSREHHVDLLLVWKIRKGVAGQVDTGRMASYIQYLDTQLMAAHFADEEALLFDQLPPDDPLCERGRKEHDEIRGMIRTIAGKRPPETDLFVRFANAVEAHVRFEERELFPYFEVKIPQEKLRKIAEELLGKHDVFVDSWQDEFWGSKGGGK